MPIYEYRCTKCHKQFEEWQKNFSSSEHEICPDCGGDAVRLISNTSFILKGKGWYVTEYGNRKNDPEIKPDSESPSSKTETTSPTSTTDSSKTNAA